MSARKAANSSWFMPRDDRSGVLGSGEGMGPDSRGDTCTERPPAEMPPGVSGESGGATSGANLPSSGIGDGGHEGFMTGATGGGATMDTKADPEVSRLR